jgi:hypothetical protein
MTVTADDGYSPRVPWSAVREIPRLIERHRKLLRLEYSAAGWKAAQMIENRMHAISDQLLTASTNYPSLRWLLDHRDVEPAFDVSQHPDLEAAASAFDYLESLQSPEHPRLAVCLSQSRRGLSEAGGGAA